MEENGVGTVTDKDGIWNELLDTEWDCKVRIYHAHFYLVERHRSPVSTLSEEPSHFVPELRLRFGPATLPDSGGPIYQEVLFKVFDSAGEQLIRVSRAHIYVIFDKM
jgi:hypothetical protein